MPQILSLIDTSTRSDGFHFEFGRDNIPYSLNPLVQIEDTEKDTPFYKLYFHGKGTTENPPTKIF